MKIVFIHNSKVCLFHCVLADLVTYTGYRAGLCMLSQALRPCRGPIRGLGQNPGVGCYSPSGQHNSGPLGPAGVGAHQARTRITKIGFTM